jgi:RNA polymerase sigma-70 factor (ECF subfamily)
MDESDPGESLGGTSWDRTLEALHPDAWGWALHCCDRDPEVAGEVLQGTYAKILSGRARFDGRSSEKTWLFSVIRLTAADHRREGIRERLRRSLLVDRAPKPAPFPDPEFTTSSSETARLLREALARISPRQREVLHLVFYQGFTLDEAAAVLGVSAGAARTHYDRGKSRLRELLPQEVTR